MRFLSFLTFKAWGGYSEAVAEWRVGSFNTQALAITAWAFAQASRLDTKLFSVLARVAERCVASFITQDLANTARAGRVVSGAGAKVSDFEYRDDNSALDLWGDDTRPGFMWVEINLDTDTFKGEWYDLDGNLDFIHAFNKG